MTALNSLPLISPIPKTFFINPDEITLIEFEGFEFLYEGKYCINDSVFFQYKNINYLFGYDWNDVAGHCDIEREELCSYHLQDYIAANQPDWVVQRNCDECDWKRFDDKWEAYKFKMNAKAV